MSAKWVKILENNPTISDTVFTYVQEPTLLRATTNILVSGGDFSGNEDLKTFHNNMEKFVNKAKISKPVTLSRSIGKDMWDKIKDAGEFENIAMSSWSLGDKSSDMFGDYKIIWDAKKGDAVASLTTMDLLEFVGSSKLKFKVVESGENFIKVESV